MLIPHETLRLLFSNILSKLGVGSRTAAAAYAFEHGLAGRVAPNQVQIR